MYAYKYILALQLNITFQIKKNIGTFIWFNVFSVWYDALTLGSKLWIQKINSLRYGLFNLKNLPYKLSYFGTGSYRLEPGLKLETLYEEKRNYKIQYLCNQCS